MSFCNRAPRSINKENSRPITGRTNNKAEDNIASAQKSPRPATPRGAGAARQGVAAVKSAPKARSGPAATVSRTGTNGARGRVAPEKSLQEKIDEALARTEELRAAEARTEVEADDAEAAGMEAEQEAQAADEEFTAISAQQLEEYSAKKAVVDDLEQNLADINRKLEEKKAKNMESSKRNIELGKKVKEKQAILSEADAELRRFCKSHDELDEELDRQAAHCEKIKYSYKLQGDQCARDIAKVERAMNNLQEVAGGSPSEEVVDMLDAADVRLARVKQAHVYCQTLQRDGPQPEPTTWDSCE